MREIKGDAGTVYIKRVSTEDTDQYDVWFEDFCILGSGNSSAEALRNASGTVVGIWQIINSAIHSRPLQEARNVTVSTAAGTGD